MNIFLTGIAVVSSLFLLSTASADEGHRHGGGQQFTKHFNTSLFAPGEKKVYSVEILPDDREYQIGKGVIGIAVHDQRDKDVAGATLLLRMRDLESGAAISTSPGVTDKGGGLYIVSGVDLKRTGRWELSVTVRKKGVEDTARFSFPEAWDTRLPKGLH